MKSQSHRRRTNLCQTERGNSLVWKCIAPLLCALTLYAGQCGAEEKYNYGLNWKAMDGFEQQLYLLGMQHASADLNLLKARIRGGEDIALSNLKWEQRLALVNLVDEQLQKYTQLTKFGPEAVSKEMGEVYEDSNNTFVPYSGCFIIAIMKLEGRPANDIAKTLEKWRNIGASNSPESYK